MRGTFRHFVPWRVPWICLAQVYGQRLPCVLRCVGLIEMPATVGALKLGLDRALDDFLLT